MLFEVVLCCAEILRRCVVLKSNIFKLLKDSLTTGEVSEIFQKEVISSDVDFRKKRFEEYAKKMKELKMIKLQEQK